MSESEESAGAGEEARSGTGTRTEPVVAKPVPQEVISRNRGNNGGGRKRGDPFEDASLRRLVASTGANKLAPDVSSEEVYYNRSMRIRRLILEFLIENENGTIWRNLAELEARAGNYAGCSVVTAHRWIYQFTRVGARHRLIEAVDHWILEARTNGD